MAVFPRVLQLFSFLVVGFVVGRCSFTTDDLLSANFGSDILSIVSSQALSPNIVELKFSDPLNQNESLNEASYTILDEAGEVLTVTAVYPKSENSSSIILVETFTQTPGENYAVIVNSVRIRKAA